MRFLLPDDVHDLADTIDPRYRALVFIAAYCRPRIGEVAALRWDRVDLLRRTVSVVE